MAEMRHSTFGSAFGIIMAILIIIFFLPLIPITIIGYTVYKLNAKLTSE